MADTPKKPSRRWSWKRFGGRFLIISIVVHLLVGLIATIWVVQTIYGKRKLTFKAGPPSPNPAAHALEHQVKMAQKQNTMTAPAIAKRITTTGLSKVSLPEMPAMPEMNAAPTQMSGMKPSTAGFGAPGAALGSVGGGSPVSFFGFRNATAGALTGTFYDLKQTRSRQATGMDAGKWVAFIQKWIRGSWDDGELKKYYTSPHPLYAPFIFIPIINANEGPKAFNVQNQVKPGLWVAHYSGSVIPAQSGKYRFCGFGDDILIVRFNGHLVFAEGQVEPVLAQPAVQYSYPNLNYQGNRGPVAGKWFEVTGGDSYSMDVLIGECPGGLFHAYLLLEKSDGQYQKTPAGLPILPIFRLSKVTPNGLPPNGEVKNDAPRYPPYSDQEAPWGVGRPPIGFSN